MEIDPMRKSPKYGLRGLLLIVIGLGFGLLLHFSGVTGLANQAIGDTLNQFQKKNPNLNPSILLVDRSPQSPFELNQLLATLDQQGMARAVCLFMPSAQDCAALDPYREKLVLGRPMAMDREAQDLADTCNVLTWAALSQPSTPKELRFPARRMPSGEPTLLGLLSPNSARFELNIPPGAYLPRVDEEQLVTGQVPRDWVQNKTVFIYHRLAPEHAGLDMFAYSWYRKISLVEYHAFAFENASLGMGWRPLSAPFFVLMMVLASLVFGALFQRGTGRSILVVVVLGVAFILLTSWLLQAVLLIRIPTFDFILLLINLLMLMIFMKYQLMTENLKREMLDANHFLEQRYIPPSFYASDAYWAQIANMVRQILQLNRTIFLERVPNDHRCKEVIAINCSISDISEMRRDYMRTPYTTALEANRPIQPFRSYLNNQSDDEIQYLTPLTFSGEVVGFWALGIERDQIKDSTEFENRVFDLASEIGALLYTRKRFQAANPKKGLWSNTFQFNTDEDLGAQLHQSTSLLSRHLSRLEKVLEEANTCMLLYDLFGRVLLINKNMAQVMRAIGFAPFDNSLSDLVAFLTKNDANESKAIVQALLQEGTSQVIPLRLNQDRTALFHLRPLTPPQEEKDANPFSKMGFLCELVDITFFSRIHEIKDEIIANTTMQLRNNLTAISLAGSFLKEPDLDPQMRNQFQETITQKINELGNLLEDSNQFLESFTLHFGAAFFPLDMTRCFEDSLRATEEFRQQKDLQVEIKRQPLLNLVLAAPSQLEVLLTALWELMIEDALPKSKMEYNLFESPGCFHLVLENRGYGLPNEYLNALLTGSSGSDRSSVQKIQLGLRHLHEWGGDLTLKSEVGRGTHLELKLRTFTPSPAESGA